MTVQQMHDQVNFGVQSIDSNRFDDFLSQEIDIALNNAMFTFIKRSYDHTPQKPLGLETSERRISELTSLIKYTEPLRTKAFTTFDDNTNITYIDLPEDLMYMIGTEFQIRHNNCIEIAKILSPVSLYRFVVIDIDQLTAGLTNFTTFEIKYTSQTGAITKVTKNILPNNIQDKDLLVSWLSAKTNTQTNKNIEENFSLYYEYYDEMKYDNSFILILPDEVIGEFDELLTVKVNNITVELDIETSSSSSYFIDTEAEETISSLTGKFYPHNDITRALVHSYKKPSLKFERIPYVVKDNKIVIYDNDEFTVEYGLIKYVRKPNIISLPLSFNCELKSQVHDEIVQLAIEELMGLSGNPRLPYQQQATNRTGG